ncbi:MAG: phasin family protein [Sphingomonadaceae bacterium]
MMAKKSEAKDDAKKGAKIIEQISEPVKKAGKAIKDGTAVAAKKSAEINVKVIDHAETNAREAFAAMRAAASADSVKTLVKIQTDFVKGQSKRSVDQAKEVGELIASFGREAMAGLRGTK